MKVEALTDAGWQRIEPQPVPKTDREYILEALGEFFAACGENGNIMPTDEAVRIADQLLIDLRLSPYSPEVREEDVEKPAWFLAWLHGTYSPDLQELAGRTPALRHEIGENLTRMRNEIQTMQTAIGDRKLTKRAKEERRERVRQARRRDDDW